MERAAFVRYTLPCTLALSLFSRLSCRARKIRPTCSQRRAQLTRVLQHCAATVTSSYGVLPRREIISSFFPLSFWKKFANAPHRLHLLWVSWRAGRGIANKIMVQFGRRFVSVFASWRDLIENEKNTEKHVRCYSYVAAYGSLWALNTVLPRHAGIAEISECLQPKLQYVGMI